MKEMKWNYFKKYKAEKKITKQKKREKINKINLKK